MESRWPVAGGALARAFPKLLLGAWAFAVVLTTSVTTVFAESRPATSLAWGPNNAFARANLAARLVAAGQTDEGSRFAFDSLSRSPINVVALRALAITAEVRGDQTAALSLFRLAHAMSRRDQPVSLWWFQYYVRRGNGGEAIRHFDIAVRTSSRNQGILFSLMASASADPRLVEPLDRLLAERPVWAPDFLSQLVDTGPRLDHVARLVRGRLDASVRDERATIQRLLDRAGSQAQLDLGWAVYVDVTRPSRGNLSAGAIRDPGFEQAEGFAPFDWALVDEADLGAQRDVVSDRQGGGAVLRLLAANGRAGEVARQLVRLEPGEYRFEAVAGAIPVDEAARPSFTISCSATPGAPLLTLRPTVSGGGRSRIAGQFSVPANCRWQSISLQIGADRSPTGNAPWVDDVMIRPIG